MFFKKKKNKTHYIICPMYNKESIEQIPVQEVMPDETDKSHTKFFLFYKNDNKLGNRKTGFATYLIHSFLMWSVFELFIYIAMWKFMGANSSDIFELLKIINTFLAAGYTGVFGILAYGNTQEWKYRQNGNNITTKSSVTTESFIPPASATKTSPNPGIISEDEVDNEEVDFPIENKPSTSHLPKLPVKGDN